jgi:hypothetical protein
MINPIQQGETNCFNVLKKSKFLWWYSSTVRT